MQARQRFARWPRLLTEDVRHICHDPNQRFCPGPRGDELGDPADNVFIINLARRPEKLQRVLQHLEQHQLSAKIVSAMDGDAVRCQNDVEALGARILPGYDAGHVNHNMPFTTGEVGCFLSHYTIWHHMVENEIPSALILEDDFDLQPDFKQRLGSYLAEAGDLPWNLMYVGRSPMENDVAKISEHVVEPGYTLWTVGYILRLDGARALLQTESVRNMAPLDDFFSIAMSRGLDGYYNDRAIEWSTHIPPTMRGLAMNPPLVMPYVGSMFKSDTAMLRTKTRYVRDLPPYSADDTLRPDPRCVILPARAEPGSSATQSGLPVQASEGSAAPMPKAWREALEMLDAFYAAAPGKVGNS